MRSPFRSADVFNREEIIDPRETRPRLGAWVEHAYAVEETRPGPKGRGIRVQGRRSASR